MTTRFSGLLGALLSVLLAGQPPHALADEAAFSMLVFTKTAGYRHQSIPAGIEAIRRLGEAHRFGVDATESAALFSDDTLAHYRVVVFLNTTGDILDASQQAAFERFIRRGGGFVGIHSASDTEYDWPWYGRLVGAYFQSHPPVQPAVLIVDRSDASTAHLPVRWPRTDEWYDFRNDPGESVEVLVRLDERTYSGGKMGAGHPITWRHVFDGGRAWYTAMGHTERSYSEPELLAHLLGGIRWAAGVSPD